MILTGKEIQKRMGKEIIIQPYHPEQVNPNSYNLCLHGELEIYTDDILDPKHKPSTHTLVIPEEGLVLEPGELYLARTQEYTETRGLVPMLIGRSSMGRLGLSVHVTSGFGDIGFCGFWTLQLTCVRRIRVYPGMKVCQIFYHTIQGEYDSYDSEKYQKSEGIVASQMYQELRNL